MPNLYFSVAGLFCALLILIVLINKKNTTYKRIVLYVEDLLIISFNNSFHIQMLANGNTMLVIMTIHFTVKYFLDA